MALFRKLAGYGVGRGGGGKTPPLIVPEAGGYVGRTSAVEVPAATGYVKRA